MLDWNVSALDRGAIDRFLADYAADFARGDLERLVRHYHYPVHVVGATAAGDPQVLVADEEQWRGILERLLGAYRRLEVASAQVQQQSVVRIGPGVGLATLRWELGRADGSAVYQFDAIYTIVTQGEGLQISSIAHNESDRLNAALGVE